MASDQNPPQDPPPEREHIEWALRQARGAEGTPPPANVPTPERIGHYRIVRVIGSGGMGTVYEAEQDSPQRAVALKVIKSQFASKSSLRRFEYESQILARLRHPAVAQIYEAGTHRDGETTVPFFAMEYIPHAKPITDYATGNGLGTRERLQLFGQVCAAVHHGHKKGIIHRDLKPGNILVDAQGQVKIIDFGVARSTDADIALTTLRTDVGQLIGTLQYMSPEQVKADPNDLDLRSDVYALGVVLYELLCEHLPYDIRGAAIYEAGRIIREQPPTRLSTVSKALRGDIETVALKALEKDRERRYQSADELRRDIENYLADSPITARPPSAAYQLRLFARKNKALFAAVASIFVVLTTATIISTKLYLSTDVARLAARRAQQAETTQRKLAERREREAFRFAYAARFKAAEQSWRSGNVNHGQALLTQMLPQADQPDLRGFGWYFLWKRCNQVESTLSGHVDDVTCLAFTPNGMTLASASLSGGIYLWDVRTGERIATLQEYTQPVLSLAFSPKGETLASIERGQQIHLWHVSERRRVKALHHNRGANVPGLAFCSDGTSLVTGTTCGAIIWNIAEEKERLFVGPTPRYTRSMFISRKRPLLAMLHSHNYLSVWNIESGSLTSTISAGDIDLTAVAFGSQNGVFAVGYRNGSISILDSADGRHRQTWRLFAQSISALRFSSDGTQLAAGSENGLFQIFDAQHGMEASHASGHKQFIGAVEFSPDGTHVATGSGDRSLRLWKLSDLDRTSQIGRHDSSVRSLSLSPDGEHLLVGTDNDLSLWDSKTNALEQTNMPASEHIARVRYAPDGKAVSYLTHNGMVETFGRATTSGLLLAHLSRHPASTFAFSPDGRHLATGHSDGTIRIRERLSNQASTILRGHDLVVNDLVFCADGSVLVSRESHRIILWDLRRNERLHTFDGFTNPVQAMALSPDGKYLATTSAFWDKSRVGIRTWFPGALRVWGTERKELVAELGGLGSPGTALAFSPDQSTLAVGTLRGEIELFSTLTWEQTTILTGHSNEVTELAFSHDGRTLISGSLDSTHRIWRGGTDEELHRETVAASRRTRMEELNVAAWKLACDPGRPEEEYAEALLLAEEAAALAGGDARILNTLGVAQFRMNDMEGAIRTLEQANRVNDGIPQDTGFLAMAYARTQRRELAYKFLKRFLNVIPRWWREKESLAILREVEQEMGSEAVVRARDELAGVGTAAIASGPPGAIPGVSVTYDPGGGPLAMNAG